MHTYLINIELLHNEHEADTVQLSAIMRSFRVYQVAYNRLSNVWLDLPAGHYMIADTEMSLTKIHNLVERTIENLIKSRGRYQERDIPTYFTLLVSEVAKTTEGKPLLLGNLHRTVDRERLPSGEAL